MASNVNCPKSGGRQWVWGQDTGPRSSPGKSPWFLGANDLGTTQHPPFPLSLQVQQNYLVLFCTHAAPLRSHVQSLVLLVLVRGPALGRVATGPGRGQRPGPSFLALGMEWRSLAVEMTAWSPSSRWQLS